jgi:hypothetical protein
MGAGAGEANSIHGGRDEEEGEREIPAPLLKVFDSFARHPRSTLLSIAKKEAPSEKSHTIEMRLTEKLGLTDNDWMQEACAALGVRDTRESAER